MRPLKFRARINEKGRAEHLAEWQHFTLDDLLDGHADELGERIDRDTMGQFTGLRDKNGKEIWEGDRYVWHRGEKLEELGTIGFEQGCFVCISDKTTFTNVVCSMIDCLEVIGNVWEGEK